jgi:hypothetical protein
LNGWKKSKLFFDFFLAAIPRSDKASQIASSLSAFGQSSPFENWHLSI